MLDKLQLSKFLLIFAVLFLTSCSQKEFFHTEVICSKVRVLVRFATAEEVKNAIIRAVKKKKKYHGTDRHTVIIFPRNRSFMIKNLFPEEAMQCSLNQIPAIVSKSQKKNYY